MISLLPRLTFVLVSVAALAGLLATSGDSALAATTFVVTKTSDSNDGVCDADCSLREAIIAANANPGADRVQLAAGTYELTLVGGGENEAATGDLDVSDDTVIDGQGPSETIVDGDSDDTVFSLLEGNDITIRDLRVQGGADPQGTVADTGGIFTRANAVLENVVVAGNDVGGDSSVGGVTSFGELLVRNSMIINNSTLGPDAGTGGLFSGGNLTIEHSVISGNSTTGTDGVGGIWAEDQDVTIRDSVISNNASPDGDGIGGLYMFQVNAVLERVTTSGNTAGAPFGIGGIFSDDSLLTMMDSTLTGNRASGEDAVGGMFVADSDAQVQRVSITQNTTNGFASVAGLWSEFSLLTLRDSDVTNNTSTGNNSVGGMYTFDADTHMERVDIYENTANGQFTIGGVDINVPSVSTAGSLPADLTMVDSEITGNEGNIGGLLIQPGAVAELERVTIADNAGAFVGGVLNDGITNFKNVTVSGNSAGVDGIGGIFNPGNLFIQYSTIANNTAAGGSESAGGIWDDGDTGYLGTIVADNSPDNCVVGIGNPFSAGQNVEGTNTCGFTHVSDQVNTDPLLGPLEDNGGFVETQSISPHGPAIDTGDCDSPTDDARGFIRPVGLSCDTGAFEFGAPFEPDQLIWADNNCSGAVGPDDAILAVLDEGGLATDTGDCPAMSEVVDVANASLHPWGDVNCDDAVDADDALDILAFFADLPVDSPGTCPDIGAAVLVTGLD